jgi:hypothetical protein
MDLAGAKGRLLIGCGVLGPILFYAVVMIEGAVRPGYNAVSDFVSYLSLGERGWVQIVNFIVFGLVMLAFALGLRSTLRTGPASVAEPILIGLFGAAVIVVGLFVTDSANAGQMSVHGFVHGLATLTLFAALSAACFVASRRFGGWHGFGLYSIITGVAIPVLLVLSAVSQSHGIGGLIQRICIGLGWAWIVLLAIRLLQTPSTL